jgi:glycosyltransferase involved in cell wall biosynthesis
MKLAFLADARSPIAINWVRWFVERDHEVHWISSRPADPPLANLASFRTLSIFPELPGGTRVAGGHKILHPAATALRHWLMPLQLGSKAKELGRMVEDIRPDLLHAMRIPQEGMTAARMRKSGRAGSSIPLLVSVWGDDFTFHARSSPMMMSLTRDTMEQVDGLHSDCYRDIKLAFQWGLCIDTKLLVEPSNGGVDLSLFFVGKTDVSFIREYRLPKDAFFILNPRGFRNVARSDTFFRAIPLVRKAVPNAHFLALRMAGNNEAESWIRKMDIQSCVTLLPALPREKMPQLFRASPVMTSLTVHDGIPNVLLEAMACGSFPICGDLESIREWIEDGKNGLLVSPADPQAVAAAIIRAVNDPGLRKAAAARNKKIIADRAEWNGVMSKVEKFYHGLT